MQFFVISKKEKDMHKVLENAVSTMNYLLLLHATREIKLPECVVDELGMYVDGLNDLISSVNSTDDRSPVNEELEKDIKAIVVKELSHGTYFKKSQCSDVKRDIELFYEENDLETDPSLLWYQNAVNDASQLYELQAGTMELC